MSLVPRATALALLLFTGCHPGTSAGGERSTARSTSLAAAPDRILRGEGIELRFRTLGSGPAVVLLHGYTGDLTRWAAVADELAQELHVVVPDLRGFGRSTKLHDALHAGPREMASDIVRLLDHLELSRAHCVGFSMGALVAAHLALEHPRRVAGAVLVAGLFYPDVESGRAELLPLVAAQERGEGLLPFLRWILPERDVAPLGEVGDRLRASNDAGALIAALRAIPEQPLDWAAVERAATPITALVSRRDPLRAHSLALAARWPRARCVELDAGDHADVILAPEVREELRALMRGAPTRDG